MNTIKKDITLITGWVRNLHNLDRHKDYVYIRKCEPSAVTANIIQSMGYTAIGSNPYALFRLSITDAENLLAILKIVEED